ncbi:unnamed protein product [marine sediment metagenome]|uniref:Uncharacterized protein n=1 Tax=marine sediment metagenome TaxID=412755 RepID=X1FRB4_9ZZZZ
MGKITKSTIMNQKIKELQQTFADDAIKIADLQQTMDDQKVMIRELENTNHARLNRIQELERAVSDLEYENQDFKNAQTRFQDDIQTKDQEIYNLQSTNRELQHQVDTANYNSLYHE